MFDIAHYTRQADAAELAAFADLRDFMHGAHVTRQEEHIARYTLVCAAVKARECIRLKEFILKEADFNMELLSEEEVRSLARSCRIKFKNLQPQAPRISAAESST